MLGSRYITRNKKCKELLDMVRSILSLNGSYCCRCNKSMNRTEVKQCSGYRRMSYCSSACQREDWLNGGHKLTCCKSFTDEKAGQFQGRFEPLITTQSIPVAVPKNDRAVAKLKELEANLNMIQLKLFLDHSDTILSQAKSLQLPLYDSVVMFDLRNVCPPKVTVEKYTKHFISAESVKGFEESRSKENITCIYASFVFSFNGDLGKEHISPSIMMQRFFPHEWLVSKER